MSKLEGEEVNIRKPTSAQFELKVLALYKDLMLFTKEVLEQKTTLEQDLEFLTTDLDFQQLMAVVYRSERKKVVHS